MEWMDKLKEDLERMEAEGLQAPAGATFASESGAGVCRATAREADLGFFEMNNIQRENVTL